ncbi:MAG: lamin tail domain-containing protein [Thermoanaerobaculia bacterium]
MNRPARSVAFVSIVVLALAVLAAPPAAALSSDVVISQVYGGGGNSGATHRNDFIELFNRGTTTVSLAGWSVQYTSATGTGLFSANVTNLSGSLAPGQYYLVQEASGGAVGVVLPTADATGTINMSGTAGKVILANTTTGLACNGSSTACSAAQLAQIVDLVGFGTANFFEGTAAAPGLSNILADFRGSNGCAETDQNGADFAANTPNPRNTATALAPCSGGATTLSINEVTLAEGNTGTTTFTFTVSLSAPAGAGGVTFDIATADGTATQPSDYTQKSLTGQTIAAGSSTYTFDVLVNGDTTTEPNETFFVNVTNVTGATVADGQGLGTIQNDDVTLTKIHDIQGPGTSSPLVGNSVTTTGIVTGVRSAGFYIQEPDASVDADPSTSEGIYVYTSSAPPAAAAVGNLVQVTGTVSEYVPSADPYQPPLTELGSPTVVQLSTGNPLPAAIVLTATNPDPAGAYDQLERYEGMRVTVPSMTVVAPTQGTTNEANATATTNGIFFGVVTGVARPFREPGIQPPDPAPTGTIPPIPRFDGNPELIRVDSDVLTGTTAVNVATGAVIANVTGPLDYTYRHYTILPETTLLPTGGMTPTAVTAPVASEFTVGSYNVERFFDTTDDAGVSDVALTTTAFNNRLQKLSLGVRDYLKMPDVLGLCEVENLTTLQAIASKISADAVAASEPDPQYAAYLVEGNDIGGIDVGFLVKTAQVAASTPRVEVVSVTQELKNTLFVNPDSSTELLNDRPPLRLNAVIHHANGASFPVTVIVNHLKAMTGVDDSGPGTKGWATAGARDRAKRQKQAEDLANLVQARQLADPTERIILVGDFNAFEFNDGYVDMVNVVAGTPTPDDQTVVPGDGVDLVNPNFVNLITTAPAAERYSYSYDGSAQSIDQVLVNATVVSGTLARREEHARVNVDFSATDRGVYGASAATRLSDHEPVVSYYQVAAFQTADLAVTKTDTPDPVTAGTNLTYTVTVTNAGPDAAASASFSDTLPAGTTFVSLPAVVGWSCTTPAVGGTGTVSCSNPSFAVGSAVFTLTVAVDPAVAAGTLLSNTATATSTTADPNAANNSGTATTTVATSADISVTKVDTPDPVIAGSNVTYTITYANAGPSVAAFANLADALPAGTTFVSLVSPGGWSCTTPAVGASGPVTCSIATFAAGNAPFTLTVAVDAAVAGGTVLSNTATASSGTIDPVPANNSATATTTVNASSGVSIAVVASPEPVAPGGTLTWTITLTNVGPSPSSVTFSDPLPAGTTFASLAPAAGWSCTTPAVGVNGTVSCSNASFAAGAATFTLVGTVAPAAPLGGTLANTASIGSATNDTDPGDNTSTSTSNVLSPALLSATKTASGRLTPDSIVTYTIVLRNAGTADQFDNAGNELVDVLPAPLVLVSAAATSGTAVATIGTNTVTWNGSIPAGGSVTVTVTATIPATATAGTTISNQATVSYDADGNGTNEATAVSDNPATGAAGDPTAFVLSAEAVVIPTLQGLGLGLLAALVALGGVLLLGRRLS